LPQVDGREASVHLALFDKRKLSVEDIAIIAKWRLPLSVRKKSLQALQKERDEGKIGKALEAKLQIRAENPAFRVLQELNLEWQGTLKELLSVSQVEIVYEVAEKLFEEELNTPIDNSVDANPYPSYGPTPNDDSENFFKVFPFPADGVKCERCWNYRTDTAQYSDWPVVCGRCREQLDLMGYRSQAESPEKQAHV